MNFKPQPKKYINEPKLRQQQHRMQALFRLCTQLESEPTHQKWWSKFVNISACLWANSKWNNLFYVLVFAFFTLSLSLPLLLNVRCFLSLVNLSNLYVSQLVKLPYFRWIRKLYVHFKSFFPLLYGVYQFFFTFQTRLFPLFRLRSR